MKKTTVLLTVLVFSCVHLGSLHAGDVDKILKNHYQAIGQDKLDKKQTAIWKGKSNLGPYTLYQKRPGKARLESKFQGVDFMQGYDGKKGWIIAPWLGSTDAQDLTEGPQLKSIITFSKIDGPFHDYKKEGGKMTFAGEGDVNGRRVYKLRLDEADGAVNYFYFDAVTYLLLKQDYITKDPKTGQDSKTTSLFHDYRNVDGVLMALTFETSSAQGTNVITTDSLKFDKDIDDGIFVKPQPQTAK